MTSDDTTLSADVAALVDEAWELHVELDDSSPLWEAPLDQIERWISTSVEHTADVVRRCDEARARLLARAEQPGTATGDTASLLTAAAALEVIAATVDTGSWLTLAHPTQGLVSYLHWATNDYALATAEHGDRYVAKLAGFPGAVDELRERLEAEAAAGRAPLTRHTTGTIEAIERDLARPVADDPFLAQAAPHELGDEDASAWRDLVRAGVDEHTRPALARLRDTLREISLPAGRDDDHPGLCHVEGGDDEYARLLGAYTRPDTSADHVHQTGRAQQERLDEDWARIGAEAFGVDDPAQVRLRVAALEGPATGDEVRRRAEALHAAAEEAAGGLFNRVPSAPCEVRVSEHGSLAFYSPPEPGTDRPGVAWFNVEDPTVWGAQLAATVFHEGIPGHHFQLALALEDTHLHEMHRSVFLSAFGEGWALYVERVAHELGLYPDAVARLGMLASDALRATRMVVDTGLHALGWPRQQAIEEMLRATGLGLTECTAEVDRYIAYPAQATSYMTGRLAIEAHRDRARDALGGDFDLATFHDVVLANGMLSLDALDVVADAWITSQI